MFLSAHQRHSLGSERGYCSGFSIERSLDCVIEGASHGGRAARQPIVVANRFGSFSTASKDAAHPAEVWNSTRPLPASESLTRTCAGQVRRFRRYTSTQTSHCRSAKMGGLRRPRRPSSASCRPICSTRVGVRRPTLLAARLEVHVSRLVETACHSQSSRRSSRWSYRRDSDEERRTSRPLHQSLRRARSSPFHETTRCRAYRCSTRPFHELTAARAKDRRLHNAP